MADVVEAAATLSEAAGFFPRISGERNQLVVGIDSRQDAVMMACHIRDISLMAEESNASDCFQGPPKPSWMSSLTVAWFHSASVALLYYMGPKSGHL